MRVVVVGLGYVGSVCSACLASRGHDVVGVDTSEWKVGCIQDGRSPIVGGAALGEFTQTTSRLRIAEVSQAHERQHQSNARPQQPDRHHAAAEPRDPHPGNERMPDKPAGEDDAVDPESWSR